MYREITALLREQMPPSAVPKIFYENRTKDKVLVLSKAKGKYYAKIVLYRDSPSCAEMVKNLRKDDFLAGPLPKEIRAEMEK